MIHLQTMLPSLSPIRNPRAVRRLAAKLAARRERSKRWERARAGRTRSGGRIAHQGVCVSVRDVKRHRYLRDRGLDHSERVASVLLPRSTAAAAAPANPFAFAAAIAAACAA